MASKRVLLAMSGGIDSTVAALLLLEQGYELFGVTYRPWDSISSGCLEKETGCCSVDALFEAKKNAEKLGFEHTILDLRREFADVVIADFVNVYLSGRTPNPCVLCNSYIKWGKLAELADQHGCQYIATGHYARIKEENNRFYLQQGIDESKDQSYFLWMLRQQDLARTLFPLGGLTKDAVREIAASAGMQRLVEKRESQEICFIPDNDYRRFLTEQVPGINEKIGPGSFILKNGQIVGQHKGYQNYTIGQRKGLEIALGKPMYVIQIDALKNTVVLGDKEDLLRTEMLVNKVNLMKYATLPNTLSVNTKIRYKNKGSASILSLSEDGIHVAFSEPVGAITPGQSAVFYEGDDVVGGGIIL